MINGETHEVLKPEESFRSQGISAQSIIYLCFLFQSYVKYGDQEVIISYYEGDSVSTILRNVFHVLNVLLL